MFINHGSIDDWLNPKSVVLIKLIDFGIAENLYGKTETRSLSNSGYQTTSILRSGPPVSSKSKFFT